MSMKLLGNLISLVAFFLHWTVIPLVHLVFKCIYDRSARKVPPIYNDILLQPATSLAKKIRRRELKSIDVIEAFIARIKEVNPYINAIVADRFEQAVRDAKEVDRLLDSGDDNEAFSEENAPFLGVPFTAKEAFGVKGMPNTSGLVSRKGTKSKKDADVITLLRRSGAIPLGLTNCSELCMWWESSNNVYGATGNPYNTSRVVGGSSGGEGSILSSGGSVIGVGSDIGGSIRLPAFFNGIFGHKPSTGLVSNDGQFPNASAGEKEFLVTGPMCRYAVDLLPMYKVMLGEAASKLKLDTKVDLKKLRYFSMEDDGGCIFVNEVDTEIKEAQRRVVTYFENQVGVKVEPIKIKKLKYSLQMWTAKMSSSGGESFSSLMGGGKEISAFWELVKWMFQCSNHTLPAICLGLSERLADTPEINATLISMCDKLKEEFQDLLGDDGVMFYPTQPKAAPYHNEPLFMPFNFAYTGVFNVLGLPVTHCPLGLNSDGLPIGMQVIGSLNNDHLTLAVSLEIEKAMGGWVPPVKIN